MHVMLFTYKFLLNPYSSSMVFFIAISNDNLLEMVRYGAEMVFSSKDSTITDEDVDRIIARGEEATTNLDAKIKKYTEDAIKFKMDDGNTPVLLDIKSMHILSKEMWIFSFENL